MKMDSDGRGFLVSISLDPKNPELSCCAWIGGVALQLSRWSTHFALCAWLIDQAIREVNVLTYRVKEADWFKGTEHL